MPTTDISPAYTIGTVLGGGLAGLVFLILLECVDKSILPNDIPGTPARAEQLSPREKCSVNVFAALLLSFTLLLTAGVRDCSIVPSLAVPCLVPVIVFLVVFILERLFAYQAQTIIDLHKKPFSYVSLIILLLSSAAVFRKSIWDVSKLDDWIVFFTKIVFVASRGCIEVMDSLSEEKLGITAIEEGDQPVDERGRDENAEKTENATKTSGEVDSVSGKAPSKKADNPVEG
ncbi:hypothetical protein E3P96_03993 [Wallemia ichthyophaga]|nr:hypothetical protein E3P96_03993 [Wallemia ichthyophaga]